MEKVKAQAIEAKLVDKKQLTVDVIELHFETTPSFQFEPGQFFSVVVPGAGPGGRDLRRAYSIASHPEKSRLEFCIKVVDDGPGSDNYLNSLQIGETMKGMAPYGDFVFKTHHEKHVIFIATGTGVAPFRSMLFSGIYRKNTPLSTTLLFGVRDIGDLLYTEEFQQKLGERFVPTVSRPTGQWEGFRGRVTDWLRAHSKEIHWKETEFYMCGNGAMIDEVKQILTDHQVEKTQIHQEIYYKPKPGEEQASQS